MADPGLPPKGRPRSLHLLESLVQEEEARLQNGGESDVVIPSVTRESTESGSPDFYDSDKQLIKSTGSPSASYSEFKMKEMDNNSKVSKGNPNAGFRGKKINKQRSDSSERALKSKKVARPYSADYNQNKRNKLNLNMRKGRPKTTKGRMRNNQTSSPKGQRSRSPQSYSSETYSSDDEYIKKKKYVPDSDHSRERNDKKETDSFFDSECGSTKPKKVDSSRSRSRSRSSDSSSSSDSGRRKNNNRSRSRSSSQSSHSDRGRSSYQNNKGRNYRSQSSSSSSSSSDRGGGSNHKNHRGNARSRSSSRDTLDKGKNSKDRRENFHKTNGSVKKPTSVKTVYADRLGQQGTSSSNGGRMVVVEDYSSLSDSDDGRKNHVTHDATKPPLLRPKKTKPLLSRKKRDGYQVFQINPDMYLEGKLQQKYSELEELMTCSFVDQKSHMTRHHLYQMELLRDQYQNASHGLPSASTIIPRSLPGEIRNRSKRPVSAKQRLHQDSDLESNSTYEHAYGTLRSVMVAERARKTDAIRTDILVERPVSAKKSTKKKKKIDASFKSKWSDTEEEISERPSFCSTMSKNSSSPTTPRNGPAIDDHIKYSENEKLKKWLKEKDKIYRKHVKEERRKKREEREQMIKNANDKLVKRLESQKKVKKWMKEKSKEWVKFQEEKRQKEKQEDEWLESHKKTKSIPGDTLRIRPQSAPSARLDANGEATDQTKKAQEGPHPPQTKFIYKRPVAGKIKLKMQVRGKSPVAPKSDTEDQPEMSEKEKAEKMRISYDDWVKKKRIDDATRKENAKRQRELAKSDPELERIIPALGRKRIEDKLNSRKKIDTGIKKFDTKTNKSFGGGDFDGEPIERPRSAYRLETDRDNDEAPALTVKQLNRPSTAPSARGRVPSPKKSANSPRKAIIPQKVDQVMANEDTSNPYTLPFPPDKGIPAHVAERQRRIFANQITDNLNEIEQRSLLNAELIKEGVSEADIAEFAERSRLEIDQPVTKLPLEEEEVKTDDHPNISEIMYSPKKADLSDSSSDENNVKETTEVAENNVKETTEATDSAKSVEVTDEKKNVEGEEMQQTKTENEKDEQGKETDGNENQDEGLADPSDGHSHYKTYDNLNELNLERPNIESNEDHLKEDIEALRERVAHLKVQPEVHLHHAEEGQVETEPTITIISDTEKDPNIIGILKESKKSENIPAPEMSEEPEQSVTNNKDDESDEPASPREDLGNSRKRVSFNEQTEVFQSFESSTSTETVTPEPEEFDPTVEGLESYHYSDDDDNDEDDRPAILKLQGEKMSINIGGMVLNPTVIDPQTEEGTGNTDTVTEGHGGTTSAEDENKPTFLTNPDEDSNV